MTSKPLNIVHTESSCGWGGQEIRILTEAEGMARRGHQLTLLCPQQAPIYSEAKRRGLSVEALPIARKKLAGALALRRWLKTHPTDIINSHSSTDSWLSAVACQFWAGAPTLVRTRHVSAPITNRTTTRWLYTRATRHIVTTGEKLRETLIRDNHFPAEMITSVPTGIDTERFQPGDKIAARQQLGLPEDAFIIGIVATLRSWKGHRHLIEAFAALPGELTQGRPLHLLIVGDGPQDENIRQQIAELAIEQRVTLPGNQQDVVPWMQALDIFTLPSYANEGVPQGILQAMLCGLPIISTPIGSITEAIHHDKTGLIIKPENPRELGAALSQLITDNDLRSTLAQGARDYALAHFSLEQMVDNMETVFRQALTHKG